MNIDSSRKGGTLVGDTSADVDAQPHYADFPIQPIDYMRGIMSRGEFCAYCQGNVIKYITRYQKKNGVQDLKKAQVYLGWMVAAQRDEELSHG